ncbi:MAG: hypothetical protein RL325_1563 [Planctomycetota bacterium]
MSLTSMQILRRFGKVGLIAVAACAVSCGDGPTQTKKSSVGSTRAEDGAGLSLLDPKDDVMGDAPAASGSGSKPAAAAATKPASKPSSQASAAKDAGRGRWSVILATFSGADHAAKAAAFRGQVVSQYPELRDAAVRRVGKGSAIVSGRFEGPEDEAAQAELKRVKAIERNGKKPFAGVMLMRTATDDASGPPKAHDLRTLRAQFPTVRPLFTLQVGAWSTFGERSADYDDMRAAAERYCAELRAKGHEAWFLHDEDSETSIVAVGHFDRRAYDPKSTLFSPEVEDLMRQFPANLVNGEPVLIPVDPRNPKGKTKPQPCRLVEVPAV